MSEKYLSIRNLARFQHYKNRGPAWVKLYAKTLRDEQFNDLPAPTRLLALYLLIVAAERGNKIPGDPAWIATECSLTRREAKAALEQLLAVAYLVPASHIASTDASAGASNGASENASESATTRARERAERREGETEKTLAVDEGANDAHAAAEPPDSNPSIEELLKAATPRDM